MEREMGKRRYQVFIAPGEDIPLPIVPSPWHLNRRVRLYLEHWHLLLKFAATANPPAANLLEQCSTSIDRDDRVTLSDEILDRLSAFLDQLMETLKSAPPLAPAPTAEILEDYTNDEYVRMLEALKAVITESRRLNMPFEAWIE
jgi:hypothetical protein